MEAIIPHPPPQRTSSKKPPARRRSVASGGGTMSSQSRSGMYSSGIYSSRITKSTMLLAGDKHPAGVAAKAHQLRVFDEQGNDVTPVPLLPANKAVPHKGAGPYTDRGGTTAGSYRVSQESAIDFLNSLESNTMASNFNSASFGKSAMFTSSKASGASMTEREDDDTSSMASVESEGEDEEAGREYSRARKPVKHWTESELAAPVSITLSETETIWLLELPGVAVSSDSPEEASVRAANETYKQLKISRHTNDNFVDRGTQTFNYFSKNKDVQATILKQANVECMVTDWNIYDTYAAIEEKPAEGAEADQETAAAGLFVAEDEFASSDSPIDIDQITSASTLHMRSHSQLSTSYT